MTRTYKIAQKLIEVTSLYPEVHEYCRNYASDGEADIRAVVTQDDIDAERLKMEREYAGRGRRCPDFSPSQLEVTAVYRRIAEQMPKFDTFVFHGSVVAVDGQAYIFTAASGTGKSTHTRLWRELFGDRAGMVNDDKPMVRVTENEAVVFGTPYNGKHRLGNDIAVPVKAVCILERAKENSIRSIDKGEAYAMLLQQTYRPSDGAAFEKTLGLIDRLCGNTELYKLCANMDISAAQTAYNAMKG